MSDRQQAVLLDVVDGRYLRLTVQIPLSARYRLFVRSVLAGIPDSDDGLHWLVPLGQNTRGELLARVSAQFERDGIRVELAGEAEREAEAELARRRSFARTMERARVFKDAGTTLDVDTINVALDTVGWDFVARRLRPHQLGSVAHALEALNAANFSVPGAGKTATALAVLATHLANNTIDLAVVVGPLASFGPWEEEAARALPGILRVRRVRGPNTAARAAIYRTAEPRDLLLLTYPTIVADSFELLRLGDRLRVMLIVDESHRIKRFRGGQWAPAMVDFARMAQVRMILSGTPMPQSPLDLWSQLMVLWPHNELTGTRETFKARADSDYPGLVATLNPIFTRTPKSALGLPDYRVIPHSVEAPPLQAEVLDLIIGRFRRRLDDAADWREQLERLRRARPLRLLQAASNPDLLNERDGFFAIAPLGDDGGTLMQRLADYRQREVPGKFTMAIDLLREQVDAALRTVVWTSFVKNIDQFADLCRRELGVPVYTVDGRVPVEFDDDNAAQVNDPDEELDRTREQRIRAFLHSTEAAILVANPAACGESISLHSACTTAIYLDRTYDCARYLQSVDRIHRLGLPPDADVQVHILQTTLGGQPTVDGLVAASLGAKQARMEQLLEGAELMPAQIPSESAAADGDERDLTELLRYLLGK